MMVNWTNTNGNSDQIDLGMDKKLSGFQIYFSDESNGMLWHIKCIIWKKAWDQDDSKILPVKKNKWCCH